MHKVYEVKMKDGYKFRFAADLVQAAATLCTVSDDGEECGTQYQTADASHDAWQAAELMAEFEDGCDPSDVKDVYPLDDEDEDY